MADPKPQPKMEPISDETWAKLKSISHRIDELNAQIDELNEEAYSLVPKHTFEECKAMGCENTHGNRWDCHHYCVRRMHYKGCFHDFYRQKEKVFKPKVDYPTLGWKTVVCVSNSSLKRPVVKETPKAIFIGQHEMLLKSTIYHIEDCTYIKSKTGYSYVCADDEESLKSHLMLLDIVHEERRERNQLVSPSC